MSNIETRRHFHEEMDALMADVVRLGGMAAESIGAGTSVFLDADLSGVEPLEEHDVVVDELTHSIEQRTYLLLAMQQPMAVDMRTLVTVLRSIHEIERIGDLMVKVAKGARRLYPYELSPRVRGIIDNMGRQAAEQLRLALSAFADRDPDRAAALPDMDDVMDDLQKDLFQAIFAEHAHDDVALQRAVQIALVGRYFERIGDHAANVAERVDFMVTGHLPYEE